MVRLLLRHSADVRMRDKDGQTPLHLAARKCHVDAAALLIEHGADVNSRCMRERTPLYGAGNVGMTRLLLQHGADFQASGPGRV